MIALANITELNLTKDLTKFFAARKILENNPESVDLRVEEEGPRKGMYSVTQPQRIVVIRKVRPKVRFFRK